MTERQEREQKQEDDEREPILFDYHFLRYLAEHITREEAEKLGRPITWLDLAVNRAIFLQVIIHGEPEHRTMRWLADAIREQCGEKAYSMIPSAGALRKAYADQKLLRLAFGY